MSTHHAHAHAALRGAGTRASAHEQAHTPPPHTSKSQLQTFWYEFFSAYAKHSYGNISDRMKEEHAKRILMFGVCISELLRRRYPIR
jgi:hypothetical protein